MTVSHGRMDGPRAQDKLNNGRTPAAERPTQRLAAWQSESIARPLGSVAAGASIQGPVDLLALGSGLRALVARHPGLRSTFPLDSDGPFQRVNEDVSFALDETDLTSAPGELSASLEAAVRRSFDVVHGPLFRAALFRLAAERHVLLLTAHPAVADWRSLDILLDELHAIYDAERQSKRAELGPQQLPGSAYFVELRSEAADARFQSALAAYKAELAGFQEPLQLPLTRPRPAVFSGNGASCSLELQAELSEALSRLAQEHDTAVDVLLYTAFTALLARYSGQADLVTAFTVENRSDEHSRAIAPLENAVVVRSRFDEQPKFVDLLETTRNALRAARTRQDVPLARLARELDAAGDASRSRLYQARFTLLEPTTRTTPECWARLDLPTVSVDCDLALVLAKREGTLVGRLEYAADLFDAAAALRLRRNFEALLYGIVADPERAVQALPLIHEDERSELVKLNDTALPVPNLRGFDELIRQQAQRTPEHIAIVSGAERHTYAEIDSRSSRLAHLLVERGVKRGTRVGIAVGRNARLLEATLGVVKAGAAYVPLDPDYPTDRLAYMIEDASIGLIVSESAFQSRLPSGTFETVLLDESSDLLAKHPETPPELERASSDVAYVIYTSGSTGRPKGVQVPHGAIVNFLISMAAVPGCSADDRLVAVTTLSFDIAVLELYLPLTVGARTVIASRECLVDGAQLAALIAEHEATIMQATPTTWQLLLDAGWEGRPGFKALCGGEAFPRRLARELIPRCEAVWNMYGPTETTVWSTCQQLTDPEAPILVGKPIANTQTYVLDSEHRLVPFGVAGELYIGGLGVTVGYLARPELTAERFVPDTFSGAEGARLYRTGDLARQWPHGLELIGRVDNQVKLRGHRIELGEIEAVIEAHHQVQRAAVVVREFGQEDSRLVAYFTRASEDGVDEELVRAALRERLPGYMVPRHFVELERMPLTPNGKIDRKALPMPETLANSSDLVREKPANAIEELVLGVWQRLLRIEHIGVTDDFFDIGGHSLLALKLVQGINEACKTSLPLGFIFEFRTIRAQAESINQGQQTVGPTVVPLARGEGTPLFCICGISLYQTLARHLGGRPVYGIFVPAEQAYFENGERRFGVREMAHEYVQAILATRAQGPYYIAGVSFGGTLAYEVAQQLRAQGHEVGFVAIMDVVLEEEFELLQGAWTTERLVRVMERGPRYWAKRARSLLKRGAGVVLAETRAIESSLRRRLSALRGEPTQPGPATEQEQAAELERLHALRDRHYELAAQEYRDQMRPYQGSVLVFRARDEERGVLNDQLTDDLGWARYVSTRDLECHTVPGNHLGILEEPNVEALAEILRAKLADAESESSRNLAAE